MDKVKSGVSYFIFTALLSIPFIGFGQTTGIIYKDAGKGAVILDPNQDGFTSKTVAGFTENDDMESEIPFVAFPYVGLGEPSNDLFTGAKCSYSDIVKSENNESVYVFSDTENLYFRFRLGGISDNSIAYSVLIDTDLRFGISGPEADPNAITGNPGFEVEIVLITNFGVALYDVDGTLEPAEQGNHLLDRPYADFAQKSVALTDNCDNSDFFYDFYIPWKDIETWFPGIDRNRSVRMAAQTVVNTSPSIGNTAISDIAGIDNNDFISIDHSWEELIHIFPPVSGADLESGQKILPRAECPQISSSLLYQGDIYVSGTSGESDGAIIDLLINGDKAQTTILTDGSWEIYLKDPLSDGDTVSATVAISDIKSTSSDVCNTIKVGENCTNAPADLSIIPGKMGIEGLLDAPDGSQINIFKYNQTLFKWSVWGKTNSISGAWSLNCGGGCLDKGTYYATAKTTGQCESLPSDILCLGLDASDAPVITTDPVLDTMTRIDGALTEVPALPVEVRLFVDGMYTDNLVLTTKNAWSITNIPELTMGEEITVQIHNPLKCPAVSLPKVVMGITDKPVITGDFCTGSAIESISGTSTEAAGTKIYVYTKSNLMKVVVLPELIGETEVDQYGKWTLTGIEVAPGNYLSARALALEKVMSDYSEEVYVYPKTVDDKLSLITDILKAGADSLKGFASPGNLVQLYVDNVKTENANTDADKDSGAWTIHELNEKYQVLYPGASIYVTSTHEDGCESDPSEVFIIPCYTSQDVQITGAVQVCFDTLVGITYSAEGMTNYRWEITGGEIVGSENDSAVISVVWKEKGRQYINLSITDQFGCISGTPAELEVMVEKNEISLGNMIPPQKCEMPDGLIQLRGLSEETLFDVSYAVDGSKTSIEELSDPYGVIHLDGLGAGRYTDFQVSHNGCVSNILTGPIALGCDHEAEYLVEEAKYIRYYENDEILGTVSDPDGEIVNAVVVAGVLPSGVSINEGNGEIYVTDVTSLTAGTFLFEVATTDESGGQSNNQIELIFIEITAVFIDVAVSNSVDEQKVEVGNSIVYFIEVTNNGSLGVTDITVNSPVGEDFLITDFNATAGTYNSLTGEWIIDHMEVKTTEILEITLLAGKSGTTNFGVTLTTQETDIDLGNNSDELSVLTIDPHVKPLPYNGFTPNNDYINDYWVIKDIENYPNNEVKLYDRYGKLVYQIQGYDNNEKVWNGQSSRHSCNVPNGTYYYFLDMGDGSKPIAGYVEIKY